MRITVKQPGRMTFWMGLPAWMVFNSLTTKIAAKAVESKGVKLGRQDMLRLVKELAEKEGVTEQLKAENAMLWVRKMNNIRNRAAEMVNNEVIYGQL